MIKKGLDDLYSKVPFDGLWLDMNEATGFCSGECPAWKAPNNVMEKAIKSSEFNEKIYSQLVEETEKFLQDYSEDYSEDNNGTWYQSYY